MKRKQNTAPIVVAVVSDLHSGSTVGLCPPIINLDDGGTYRAGPHQVWLWNQWKDFCKKARQTAKKQGGKFVAIMNGDMTEGNHHHTRQIIGAGNETLQMRIAEKNLGELLEHADAAYFLRGTPVHVKEQSALEEKVADNWTTTVPAHDGAATWWHLLLDANGTRFDVAHHGQLGRLVWTKTNPLGKVAIAAEIRGYRRYGRAPDVLIRSHLHQYADSNDNYPVRVIQTPGWQLITGFVHKIDVDSLADIGGLIFTCDPGGEYDCEVVRYHPDPDPVQRIEL